VQKGTGVDSRLRGILTCLVILAHTVMCARLYAAGTGPVWVSARGGATEPGEWFHYSGGRAAGHIALITGCSQPYSIENCYRSFAALGFRSVRYALWCDWLLLYHPLLREDAASAVFGMRILSGAMILVLRPTLRRAAVRGFIPETEYSCGISCSYIIGAVARIGVEGYTAGGRDRYIDTMTGKISLHAGVLRAVVNRMIRGRHENDVRIGVEIEAGRGMSLLAGYRSGTDEISVGVLYRTRRYIIGVSWSDHESLGTTLGFGVGRLWLR
jgi:hypothetical protein